MTDYKSKIRKNEVADVLAYRITRRHESTILNDEIIENNLVEASRSHNNQYIMSAGTAWLRKNSGKTLRDLEQKFEDLGVQTIIIATPYTNRIQYDLCVPGSPARKLKYVGSFINGMREHQKECIKQAINCTPEENLKMLEDAGYSCAKGQAPDVATQELPDINMLRESQNIMTQLQWASISITIDITDPIRMEEDEMERLIKLYGREPYQYKVNIDEMNVCIFVVPQDGRMQMVSDFAIMHRDGKKAAIPLNNFLKNRYLSQMQSSDAEKKANETIKRIINDFNIQNIVNIREDERIKLIEYINTNGKSDNPMEIKKETSSS